MYRLKVIAMSLCPKEDPDLTMVDWVFESEEDATRVGKYICAAIRAGQNEYEPAFYKKGMYSPLAVFELVTKLY